MENPSYYAVIPANVRYDKNLKDKAKLLYGEISALCNKSGICYATNNYFAELYGVSAVTISGLINDLVKAGYITSEIIYKEGTKEILNRYLKIFNDPIKENFNTPIKENFKGNNTSNNNIPPIVPQGDDMPKEDVRPYNFDILWQEYPKKEGKASAYRSYCSWLVGKKTPLGKRKLTNEEIDTAIQNYNNKIQKEHIEYKYIKQGSTFFNLGILDYLGDGTSD